MALIRIRIPKLDACRGCILGTDIFLGQMSICSIRSYTETYLVVPLQKCLVLLPSEFIRLRKSWDVTSIYAHPSEGYTRTVLSSMDLGYAHIHHLSLCQPVPVHIGYNHLLLLSIFKHVGYVFGCSESKLDAFATVLELVACH